MADRLGQVDWQQLGQSYPPAPPPQQHPFGSLSDLAQAARWQTREHYSPGIGDYGGFEYNKPPAGLNTTMGQAGSAATNALFNPMTYLGGWRGTAENTALAGLEGAAPGAEGVNQGIFIGPEANTAKLDLLRIARARNYAPGEKTWENTGWFHHPLQGWRSEINDRNMSINDTQSIRDAYNRNKKLTIDDIIQHPDFFNAYPELHGMEFHLHPNRTGYRPGNPLAARYDPGTMFLGQHHFGSRDQVSIPIIHELQHAAQSAERVRGQQGSRKGLIQPVGGTNPAAFLKNPNPTGLEWDKAMERYQTQAGEVEARNAEIRRGLSTQQRMENPPWHTQDIPFDRQWRP